MEAGHFTWIPGKQRLSEESYNIYGLRKGRGVFNAGTSAGSSPGIGRCDGAMDKLVKEGVSITMLNSRIRRPSDNDIVYIHSVAEHSKKENSVSGIIQDITERYLAEEEIKKSEEKFRLIADNSLDCIWQLDKKLRFTYLSPSLYDITGFKPEEWIGTRISQHTNWVEFIKMSRLALMMLKNYSTFSNVTFETRMYNKEGDLIPLEIASKPLFEDGKLIGLQGSTRDIRNRTEAELKLRESEEKNRFLFENMVQGVIYHDSTGQITDSNKAAAKILGLTHDQLVGKTSKDPRWRSIHEDGSDYPGEEHPVMVSLKSGKPVRNSVMGVFIPEEESYRWININSIPKFKDDNPGKLTEVVVTIEDITELRKAVEKAEESDRLKSSFLANMSHEIRTPMNGIIGFTNLLNEPDLTVEEKRKYIEIIQKSGDRMLNTVNDLIDISKIETGQAKIALSETRLNEKIENLFNFFKQQADEKGLDLEVTGYLEEGTDVIITDSTKLDSILSNLIKNAIKYTDRGKIEISCIEKSNILTFSVKDTGIGVPADKIDAIFNRFEQADITNRRAFEGSGLGLTIAKAYVEMLGGKIWVESEVERGTAFYFTLPAKRKTKSEPGHSDGVVKSDDEKTGKKLKIIIEDDEPSFMYLSAILKKGLTAKYCVPFHGK
ncbi:MAG: PAS domain-containing sensor histidine kinase [Bacteroidales bacterium]